MRCNACTFAGLLPIFLLATHVFGSLGHAVPLPAPGEPFLLVPPIAQVSGPDSSSLPLPHDFISISSSTQPGSRHSETDRQQHVASKPVEPQQLDSSIASAPTRHPSPNQTRSIAPAPRIRGHHHHRHRVSPPVYAPAAPMVIAPPPNNTQDCSPCGDGYTITPPGTQCGCVIPITTQLQLGINLETLFPLVSELAMELAYGLFLQPSQVRIVGANAVDQNQDKTDVSAEFVPLHNAFDGTTAELLASRFWTHQVMLNETLFGSYAVLLVRYPGLPPSPPSQAPYGSSVPPLSDGGPSQRPIGVTLNSVDHRMSSAKIAVIALSSIMGAVISLGGVWIVLLRCSILGGSPAAVEPVAASGTKRSAKSAGGSILSGSVVTSTSISFGSSMPVYTGTAKCFSLAELERATDNFKSDNIVGEGGFGIVYQGILDDDTLVAAKVLTRDDQQGGLEFVAEVEMLSRLHHRNLVKLIGICTEESWCLVFELIPNGSVESHLHGVDRFTAPLDWEARVKIALGAARGLAYLHEDSNPRVIHRDFKASNILLEDDFTPKVSDFGLAKAAAEGGHNQYISTKVMGTFGYVAPEYAMTGHLLVKSDVYSYGVVLLELLSGRQPVDMSQPQGQENLVTWARPLLTTKEGLELLVDPNLRNKFPFDNYARVAAIASMCVQPEVSHRPFMSEVVQSLKSVYDDSDPSEIGSNEDSSNLNRNATPTDPRTRFLPNPSFISIDYDSGPQARDMDGRPLSASAVLSGSGRFIRQLSGSFRRHSASGPLKTSTGQKPSAWYRFRGPKVTRSDHGVARHDNRLSHRDYSNPWP